MAFMTPNDCKNILDKCEFVHFLFVNYTAGIFETSLKFKIPPDDANKVVTDICILADHEYLHRLRATHNAPPDRQLSITQLRKYREYFIPKFNVIIDNCKHVINTNKTQENTMSVTTTPTPEAKPEIKPEVTQTKKTNPQLGIQDLIKLRRITSTSVALTSLLENVYVLHEARYAHYSVSNKPTIQPSEQQAWQQLQHQQAWLRQAVPSGSQPPGFHQASQFVLAGPNPYGEMSFSQDQLNKADEKIMELLQILFPDESPIQS